MVSILTLLLSVTALVTGIWTGGSDRMVAAALVVLLLTRYAVRRHFDRRAHRLASRELSGMPVGTAAPTATSPVGVP
jgi:hypothetical protein